MAAVELNIFTGRCNMNNTKTAEITTLDADHKFIFPVLVKINYIELNPRGGDFYIVECPMLALYTHATIEEEALEDMRQTILGDYLSVSEQDNLTQNLYKALLGIT